MADEKDKKQITENQETTFQKLARVTSGKEITPAKKPILKTVSYSVDSVNTYNGPLLMSATPDEVDLSGLQKQQKEFLAHSYKKAEYSSTNQTLLYNIQRPFLYREYDQMELFPEISVAWDIISTESTYINQKGAVLNVYSDNPRVKLILEDLFVNRLQINTNLRLWSRMMCKYGDDFLMLDLDDEEGVIGCQQLPIYEVERRDPNQLYANNGAVSKYGDNVVIQNVPKNDVKNSEDPIRRTKFILRATGAELQDFQVVHFRYTTDALTIPYGTSTAFKARRYWRMLMLAEDAMAVYRIYRAMDRRLFKIYVGNIDDADVPAYISQVQNQLKRKEVYDPQTGMIDTKFNIMGVTEDIFLPVRDNSDSTNTTLEIMNGSNNTPEIVDVKFWREKLVCALRVPAAFLNFGIDGQGGGGKNLALLHTQFAAFVNHIQIHLLQGLNQIARTHLVLLGMGEEINNFRLSLNNPSNQAKLLYLEELDKKITISTNALRKTDAGIPIMSWTTVMREIIGLTDDDIKKELLNIRLETALAEELLKTKEIIKKTHYFDPVDNIYGDRDAKYSNVEGESKPSSGGGSSGGFGGGISSSDFGGEGDLEGNQVEIGEEGAEKPVEAPVEGGEAAPATPETAMESLKRRVSAKILVEKAKVIQQEEFVANMFENYFDKVLSKDFDAKNEVFLSTANSFRPLGKTGILLNEDFKSIYEGLSEKKDNLSKIKKTKTKLI